VWDGSNEFVFRISGRADSDYAANTDDRRSVSGGRTFLNGCAIIVSSSTQKTVGLSVTESSKMLVSQRHKICYMCCASWKHWD
jgi:hypothetical protein